LLGERDNVFQEKITGNTMTTNQKQTLLDIAKFFLGAGIIIMLTINHCDRNGCEWGMYKIIPHKSTAGVLTFFLVFYSFKLCFGRDNLVTKITGNVISVIHKMYINLFDRLKQS
jgi:hypothetical protein